jgi:hypothetical protein
LYRLSIALRSHHTVSVSDQDWLEKGHGGGEGLRPMIKGSTGRVGDRASIRSVLRGDVAAPRKSRRRNKAMVGWLLYCCTAVGGTAAAFTVRDTLFPSLGAPTKPLVWASSNAADTTLTTEHGSSSIADTVTSAVETTLSATTVTAPAQSTEGQSGPPAADASQGPGNSVGNHGPASGPGPQTGTTVADNPSDGPGPSTTVGTDPTDTSTPGSVSTPPNSADPTPSTPADPATTNSTPGDQKGKGGGGGGGGGDGGGGGGGDGDGGDSPGGPPAP